MTTLFAPAKAAEPTARSTPTSQLYQQALHLKKADRCDRAIPVFETALSAARKTQNRALELNILRHRGECYQYQGDYALAWLDLAYGQTLAPEDALFYEALGWLAIFEGRYRIAQRYLEQAQHIAPENPWVQLNLGWAYYLQGNIEPAFLLWQPLLQSSRDTYRKALQREIAILQKHTTATNTPNPFGAVKAWLKRPHKPKD